MRHLQLPRVSLGRPNRPTIATEDLSLADVIDGYADGRPADRCRRGVLRPDRALSAIRERVHNDQ